MGGHHGSWGGLPGGVRTTGRAHARPTRQGMPVCAVVPFRAVRGAAPLVPARRTGVDVAGQRRRDLLRGARGRTAAGAGAVEPAGRVHRLDAVPAETWGSAVGRAHDEPVRQPRPGAAPAGSSATRSGSRCSRTRRTPSAAGWAAGRSGRGRRLRLQPVQARRRQGRRLSLASPTRGCGTPLEKTCAELLVPRRAAPNWLTPCGRTRRRRCGGCGCGAPPGPRCGCWVSRSARRSGCRCARTNWPRR